LEEQMAKLLTIVAVAAAFAVSELPVLAEQGPNPARYVEFLARPSSYIAGHSFVQIGTIARDGSVRVDRTIGLYPARYPHTDSAALNDAPGKIMKTPSDLRVRTTARYRIDVSESTYREALAHAQRITAAWHRYDLATENCNKVIFEFADRLGLEVRRDMLDLPANVVRALKQSNGGRTRASWRPARPWH
jgi:Domain of unknown function (DUF4105)